MPSAIICVIIIIGMDAFSAVDGHADLTPPPGSVMSSQPEVIGSVLFSKYDDSYE